MDNPETLVTMAARLRTKTNKTDNTMTKRKSTKGQTTTHKT
jgi:hypothetical protein